jgi:DNA (cytosine-5)-methyltransferase 1
MVLSDRCGGFSLLTCFDLRKGGSRQSERLGLRTKATMQKLTFGSLFAGIGGIDLGFERCGMECKWQVEIDDYAQKVLAKHWPEAHRERDIRECSTRNLGRVDIIAGGFPCQDISYAGLGAGLDGERSGLFFEAVRLVRELQPRAVVLENVAALLTRGLDRVLGTLAEIGYDAEWHCIPAAYVGAPHIRDRVFILGYANCGRRESGGDAWETARHRLPTGAASSHASSMADTDLQHGERWAESQQPPSEGWQTRLESFWRGSDAIAGLSSNWSVEPDICRVAHGIPARVDRLRGLGNAVVPQVAEYVGRMVISKIG